MTPGEYKQLIRIADALEKIADHMFVIPTGTPYNYTTPRFNMPTYPTPVWAQPPIVT